MIEVIGVDEKEAERLRGLARHALCFAVMGNRPVPMAKLPFAFVVYDSPAQMAKALGLPETTEHGRVVARTNLQTGVIYLGQTDDRTVYYECGRWMFQDVSGEQTGSREMETFADYCEDHVA